MHVRLAVIQPMRNGRHSPVSGRKQAIRADEIRAPPGSTWPIRGVRYTFLHEERRPRQSSGSRPRALASSVGAPSAVPGGCGVIDVLELMLADTHYALPLDRVIEVVPRVEITRIPDLAPPVQGFFVYRGEPLAAVDMRHRLGYPARPPALEDHFVVAHARTQWIALVVDRALGVREVDPGTVRPPPAGADVVAGVSPLDSDLLLISDLDAVLSLEQDRAVTAALRDVKEPA